MSNIKDINNVKENLKEISNEAKIKEFTNPDLIYYKSTVDNDHTWKLFHGISYLIGGITFVLGSFCYYPFISPYVNGDVVGGWLYTIGSLSFLIADLKEWNHFKLGCIGQPNNEKVSTWKSYLTRAQVGINFFLSACGSLLYLLGSIFFIPATNNLTLGELLFIYGSIVIFLSQLWKCLRTSFYCEDLSNCKFNLDNIKEDLPGFLVDVFAGLGGLSYAIGTYDFMVAVTSDDLLDAVNLFVIGGLNFFLSGICMQYRYFFNKKNNQVKDPETNQSLENKEVKEKLIDKEENKVKNELKV